MMILVNGSPFVRTSRAGCPHCGGGGHVVRIESTTAGESVTVAQCVCVETRYVAALVPERAR